MEVGRLAIRTGAWPLKEYDNGRVVHTRIPHLRTPVDEYLVRQGRLAHLFAPERNQAEIARIQGEVDAYWAQVH
ncbi:MAG: hypothetical protein HY017_19830 [Betaproteobacteria bacterium]|nr:hypothetical protein [Betaproteobacteria bacterium]